VFFLYHVWQTVGFKNTKTWIILSWYLSFLAQWFLIANTIGFSLQYAVTTWFLFVYKFFEYSMSWLILMLAKSMQYPMVGKYPIYWDSYSNFFCQMMWGMLYKCLFLSVTSWTSVFIISLFDFFWGVFRGPLRLFHWYYDTLHKWYENENHPMLFRLFVMMFGAANVKPKRSYSEHYFLVQQNCYISSWVPTFTTLYFWLILTIVRYTPSFRHTTFSNMGWLYTFNITTSSCRELSCRASDTDYIDICINFGIQILFEVLLVSVTFFINRSCDPTFSVGHAWLSIPSSASLFSFALFVFATWHTLTEPFMFILSLTYNRWDPFHP
jgi:hypothetical protein